MEPQMDTDEHRLNALTEKIIGCAYRVANGLGCGFLEKPYENALAHEFRKAGISFQRRRPRGSMMFTPPSV
jgi:GxxExxY protein